MLISNCAVYSVIEGGKCDKCADGFEGDDSLACLSKYGGDCAGDDLKCAVNLFC